MCPSFEDDLLQSYSDDELKCYIHDSPRLAPISSVFILSANLLAKHYEPHRVEDVLRAMDVARGLGVRVPCVKRTVKYEADAYCIMERIKGTTLEEAWAALSWFSTIKLALQLRRFINLIRSVTSLTAGSLATGACRSFWLEDRYGLPAGSSPEVVSSFIEFWAGFVSIQKAKKAAVEGTGHAQVRVPPKAKTFVFTHHDLAPRNILLDTSSQLWLLDWDYAGFYPMYFEYASMQNFFKPQDWTLIARLRWHLFTWITVGHSEQAASVLRRVRWKFTRYPVGRRFEILENKAPSAGGVS